MTTTSSPEEYLKSINGDHYDGFNLIIGSVHNGLWFSSNLADNGAVHKLSPGIHGLSNHYMNAPGWPKVETAKRGMKSLLQSDSLDEDALVERLFDILRNDNKYAKEELQDTGIGPDLERLLSSMFVKADDYDYGTRASTVILANKNGDVRFVERTFGREHVLEHQSEHCISGNKC